MVVLKHTSFSFENYELSKIDTLTYWGPGCSDNNDSVHVHYYKICNLRFNTLRLKLKYVSIYDYSVASNNFLYFIHLCTNPYRNIHCYMSYDIQVLLVNRLESFMQIYCLYCKCTGSCFRHNHQSAA